MATENLSRIASDFETQLSGAISIAATSFTLQSVTDTDGTTLSNGIYCFTIDRDSTGAKEYLIGQLDNSTKIVSSVSSVGRQGVLTANAQRAHRIGANVIISDHSILSAISRIFSGQGTINPAAPLEYTTAPTISSSAQLATKAYVDATFSATGTSTTDRIILASQTAGETVAAGNIVYFKSSDSRWWLADADLTATFSNVQLGVALGSGTAGNPITGGVQIYGKCDSFTGLTATATYYLSNTAGAVSTSAGTNSVILGQAFATTGIFFNPNTTIGNAISTSAGAGDAGKLIKTNASGFADETFIPFDYLKTWVVTSGTATKNMADGSTTQTIAHGLGVIPKKVTLNTFSATSGSQVFSSNGVFTASGNFCTYIAIRTSSTEAQGNGVSSTQAIYLLKDGASSTIGQSGIVTVDATNITITWTEQGGGSTGTRTFIWTAEGYTI